MGRKKDYSRRVVPRIQFDETATPERQQKSGGVVSETVARTGSGQTLISRQHVVSECVLDTYYYIRSYLTREEYQAGLKFRKAYLRAVCGVRVDEDSAGAKDPEMPFLMRPYSEQLLQQAYGALSAQQKQVIISVCGHDEWATTTARIKTLHRGLAKLATLWSLSEHI